MLAGVAAGMFNSFDDALAVCNSVESYTEPNAENTAQYERLYQKYKLVHDALAPIYHGL